MSKLSDQIRMDFAAGDAIRDEGLKTPADVKRYDDIAYGADEKYNLLDVYRPAGAGNKSLPVIAIVHGGAWVYGDKEVYQFYGMSLAQRGFAVVNFSYRLAPEHRFPAQLEDICAAFDWIGENGEKYGLDINNVFAVGDSAGGHLLGLFAALCVNPGYRKALADKYPKAGLLRCSAYHGSETVKLKAVALNCGKYSLSKLTEEDPNLPVIMGDFLTEGGSEDELFLTDVLEQLNEDYPEVFLMTCPGDFLKNQAPLIVKAMVDKGIPFKFRYYGSAKDPLHHVFHCNVRLKPGQKCNDDECAFFMNRVTQDGEA
ncbi:MAG: alpha/beta hydrolase [Lachnospiraceae bacterium]|nr:alpha/beta hydrolase [Lachnospiraceae bacterium]